MFYRVVKLQHEQIHLLLRDSFYYMTERLTGDKGDNLITVLE